MKVYLAADHNGWSLKESLLPWLKKEGYEVEDLGPKALDPADDYPDWGVAVARAVAEDPASRRGIAVCGSGVGMAVAANKIPGIRAAVLHDPKLAAAAQRDDDVNVLALGSRFIDEATAREVIMAWIKTPFAAEERFVRRLNKIAAYEAKCSCSKPCDEA